MNETKELKGTIDVIGLDVLKVQSGVVTEDEAKKLLEDATREDFVTIDVDNNTYIIRSTVSDLNRITSVIPEDLEANVAIQVQVKISEILQKAGIQVGINEDMKEEIEKATAEIKEEINNVVVAAHESEEEVGSVDADSTK